MKRIHKEIIAATLLGIVTAFFTWQFVEHLAK